MEPCLVLIMLWFCGGAREPSGVAHLALPSSDWLCESHALEPRLAVRMGSQWWSWVTGGRGGGARGQGSVTPSADGRGEGAAQTRGAAPGHVPRGRGGATGERVLRVCLRGQHARPEASNGYISPGTELNRFGLAS